MLNGIRNKTEKKNLNTRNKYNNHFGITNLSILWKGKTTFGKMKEKKNGDVFIIWNEFYLVNICVYCLLGVWPLDWMNALADNSAKCPFHNDTTIIMLAHANEQRQTALGQTQNLKYNQRPIMQFVMCFCLRANFHSCSLIDSNRGYWFYCVLVYYSPDILCK